MLFLGKPLDLAYEKVPAGLKESISNALLGVLTKVRDHSRSTVNQSGIYDALSQDAGLDVRSPETVARLPLPVVDAMARRILAAHRNLAVVQGGATGMAGLPGLIADIPSLYFLVFRTVEEIGFCYGFPADSEEELEHVLKIVDVGHYLESDKKRKGMLELESMQDLMRRGAPIKDMERTVIAKSLQTLSRQMATAITRRKLAQTVAIVGSLVGASVNSALVSDVGETAYHAYRRRFILARAEKRAGLKQRASTPPPEPAAETPPDAPTPASPPESASAAAPPSGEPPAPPETPEPAAPASEAPAAPESPDPAGDPPSES